MGQSQSSLLNDAELDIEEELSDDEHAHAIPFCPRHKTGEFFPISGTIVEVLCGKLIRVKRRSEKKKCPKCKAFHGRANCHYCGKELYG